VAINTLITSVNHFTLYTDTGHTQGKSHDTDSTLKVDA